MNWIEIGFHGMIGFTLGISFYHWVINRIVDSEDKPKEEEVKNKDYEVVTRVFQVYDKGVQSDGSHYIFTSNSEIIYVDDVSLWDRILIDKKNRFKGDKMYHTTCHFTKHNGWAKYTYLVSINKVVDYEN